MKILIDSTDYTLALDAVRPLEIVRKLNEPSTCRMWLTLPVSGVLAAPMRNQALSVTGDDGTLYFTGYLAVSPLPEYAGLGLTGPRYRLAIEAVSDEILLDTQLLPPSAGTTGDSAGALLQGLVARTGLVGGMTGSLHTSALTLSTPVSQFVPEAGAKWSRLAGAAATQARAAYRAVSGALALTQVGTTVHSLNEADGTLELANLALTAAVDRALANDVTVCGAEEPVAFVTEFFYGDGSTTLFPLAELPYFGSTASERIIWDLFEEPGIDLRRWGYSASPGYYSITSAGLTIDGGTGVDGEAALLWNDRVEAGGTLMLEAVGTVLSPGSTGTIAALYSGVVEASNCVAGFAVSAAEGTGAVSVSPLVAGVVAGPSYALSPGYEYTLRMRLHCPEVERIAQAYRVVGDAGLVEFGGGGLVAKAWLEMEVEQAIDGVSGTPYVIYDSALSFIPAAVTVAAASSVNLIGSIRCFFLKGLGTGWVKKVAPGGSISAATTRRLGTPADASECQISRTGILSFYTGYQPAVGEIVEVQYRTIGRAVGRAVNAASQAALAAAGSPATAVWTGTVTEPPARSSLDCRNAAMALVTAASSVSAAWSGSFRTSNFGLRGEPGGDVWPGDALLLNAPSVPVDGGGLDAQVFVRAVTLKYKASDPDVVEYAIAFSNDWANDLSVKTSTRVPEDAWLPAAIAPTYLANLDQLVVTAITPSAVSMQTNVTPPAGGGFEVRRRDFAFGLSAVGGTDADLVMRSSVAAFDIPRATESDRFYVRMYDARAVEDGGPNYSEFSAGVFVNLPLSI